MSDVKEGTYSERFGVAFQRHALACLIRKPAIALRSRTALDKEYFNSEEMKIIAGCYLAHLDQHRCGVSRELLTELVKETCQGETEAFTSCEKVIERLFKANIDDAPAVAAKLLEFGRTQAMFNAVLFSATQIEAGNTDAVMPEINKALKVGRRIGETWINYTDVKFADRTKWYEDSDDVIPTGLEHLDMAMEGGPRRGELIVTIGAMKRGKSTFLINIGYGALASPEGFNVLHYTLELKGKYVARRYDARVAGPTAPLRKEKPNRYRNIVEQHAKEHVQGRLIISEHATGTLSASMIDNEIDEAISNGFTPDLITVDYAGLMRPDERIPAKEIRLRFSKIYEELRRLAQQRNVVVWTAAQSNRAAYSKDVVIMSDIGEDIGMVQIADGILTFNQTEDEKHEGVYRTLLAGYRNSGDGMIIKGDIDRARCYLNSTSIEPYMPNANRARRARGEKMSKTVGGRAA